MDCMHAYIYIYMHTNAGLVQALRLAENFATDKDVSSETCIYGVLFTCMHKFIHLHTCMHTYICVHITEGYVILAVKESAVCGDWLHICMHAYICMYLCMYVFIHF
jgi:hypothetical protein